MQFYLYLCVWCWFLDQSLKRPEAFFRSQFMQVSIWLVTIPPPAPGPLIFSIKIPAPGQLFSAKLRPKNETIIPTPRHNLPSLNAKISMKKEHNTITAVSFQIFHNLSISQFSFFVTVKYSQVFLQHLRLMLFEVWRQFENHSQCRKPRYFSVTMLTCAIHTFLGISAN